MIGYYIGFVALAFGILVPIPQLMKIFKTGRTGDVSILTYVILCLALSGYLIHAIYIKSIVFSLAQGINLISNLTVLIMLIKRRGK